MTNSIKFTSLQKQLILSTARTIFGDFIKKKNVLKARREKIVADAKAALDKKLESVDADLMVIEESQKGFEANMIQMLGGHRLEDVVNFEPVTSESGRTSLKVSFKYPDTILPPCTDEIAEDESTSSKEPEMQAENEFKPVENPTEDRKADIDEDMTGEYVPTPEDAEAVEAAVTEPEAAWEDEAVAAQTSPVAEPDAEEIDDMWDQLDGAKEAVAEATSAVDDDDPFGLD